VVYSSSPTVKRETYNDPSGSIVVEAIARVQHELVNSAAAQTANGKSKKITKETITIELSAPGLPNVTLIDLPGLFKANLTDQAESDIHDTLELTQKYMKESRTLVLAVVKVSTQNRASGFKF
jgi:hypothetical protein